MKPIFFLNTCIALGAAAADLEFTHTRYFGGAGMDTVVASAVDAQGNLLVVGTTKSFDIPGNKITRLSDEANLLRSPDGGRTWSRAGQFENGVFSAFASHASRPTVVLACGGGTFYRSTDGGLTWNRTETVRSASCFDLSSDPADPRIFYSAGADGILATSDAGVTWRLLSVLYPLPYRVDVDPFDSSVLFTHTFGPIRRSTDRGRTWKQWLEPSTPDARLAPDRQRPGRAYAAANNFMGPLFVTSDHGETWKRQGAYPGHGEYLLAAPDSPGVLWTASRFTNEVYRSVDEGLHWSPVGVLPSVIVDWIALSGGALLATTRQGIFQSDDRGETWTPRSPAPGFRIHGNGARGEVLASVYSPGDVFVSKFGPGLREVRFTTILGGQGADQANALRLDSQGNIIVAAQSAVLPSSPSAAIGYEAVVYKLAADGERFLFAKRLGNVTASNPAALTLDEADNIYVGGTTASDDWPTTPTAAIPTAPAGRSNGFAVKLSPAGELLYSTYLGGSGSDVVSAIATGQDGSAWLTGSTDSPDFPVTSDALQSAPRGVDAFVVKLNPAGSTIDYATYQGGASWDAGSAIAIDSRGGVFVAGATYSRDFPTSPNAFATTHQAGSCVINFYGGSADGFVMKLDGASRAREFSTLTGSLCSLRFMQMKLVDDAILLAGEVNPTRMPDIYPFRMDPAGGTPVAFAGEMSLDGAAWKIAALLPGGAPTVVSSGGSVFLCN